MSKPRYEVEETPRGYVVVNRRRNDPEEGKHVRGPHKDRDVMQWHCDQLNQQGKGAK